jgi:hypothetical protein
VNIRENTKMKYCMVLLQNVKIRERKFWGTQTKPGLGSGGGGDN